MAALVKELVDNLMKHDRGKIIVCNVLLGLRHKLYDEEFVRALFDWWSAVAEYSADIQGKVSISDLPPIKLIGSLDLLLFEPLPNDFRSGQRRPDFSLVRKSVSKIDFDYYLTVIPHDIFWDYLVNESDHKKFAAKYPGAIQNDNAKVAKTYEIGLQRSQTIGNPKKPLWLTLWAEVMPTHPDADSVRDLLGIAHFGQGTKLIAVKLPRDELGATAAGNMARPSFADAGSHSRFKNGACTTAKRKRSAWGHTANLKTLIVHGKVADGAVERVCKSPSTDDIKEIQFANLGPLSSTHDEIAHNPSFSVGLLRMTGCENFKDLQRELMKIL